MTHDKRRIEEYVYSYIYGSHVSILVHVQKYVAEWKAVENLHASIFLLITVDNVTKKSTFTFVS